MILDSPPTFRNTPEYLRHVQYALDNRLEPWPPTTLEQLTAAVEAFPEESHRWRPSRADLRGMGLPRYFGRPIPPLSEFFQERWLQTIQNKDFARANVVCFKDAAR